MSVHVAIPAFRNHATIGPLVRAVKQHDVPLLVVDDGSDDGGRTACAAALAGARVVEHAQNQGKGAALCTAFRLLLSEGATGVVTLDADGQHDPDEIPGLLELAVATGADLIVGQRSFSQMPRGRVIGNTISSLFISLFCRQRLPDTQCGFRYYSAALLRCLPLRGGRFEFESELLIRAVRCGLDVRWLPIRTIYAPDHSSHFDSVADTLRVMRTVLRTPTYPRGPCR